MKIKGRNLSAKTIALLVAALLLMGTGGSIVVRAALNVTSDDYDMDLSLEKRFEIQLLQNDQPIGTKNDVASEEAKLFTSIQKPEPGKPYKDDVIAVKNNGTAEEYVRVIVRKYWTEPQKSDEQPSSDGVKKDLSLSPDLIELKASKGWTVVADADREETSVYYLKRPLAVGETVRLFDYLRISPTVLSKSEMTTDEQKQENGKVTVITYSYKYNGFKFNIEAEAQALQTHNSEEAIRSVWGIDPASVGIELVD